MGRFSELLDNELKDPANMPAGIMPLRDYIIRTHFVSIKTKDHERRCAEQQRSIALAHKDDMPYTPRNWRHSVNLWIVMSERYPIEERN